MPVRDANAGEIDALLAEGKLVIIDFHASWCAPCHAYSPKFARIEREMRRQFPDAKFAFVSVDIDQQQDLAREASVRSVPTTLAWTMGRSLFGRIVSLLTRGRIVFGRTKKKQVLRFSGDRAWEEMVRTFRELLATAENG